MADLLKCEPSLYHYNGFCFNKARIPPGEIAIPEHACLSMDKEQEIISKIID